VCSCRSASRVPVATPAEIVALIDESVARLVLDDAVEVEVSGQRFRAQDLDKLRLLRREYAQLADIDAVRGTRRGPIIQAIR
jgi:hypothetical protein